MPAQNRGSAIGAYVVWLDRSLALAGPAAELLVVPLGYRMVYVLGAGCAAFALLIVTGLLNPSRGAAQEAGKP